MKKRFLSMFLCLCMLSVIFGAPADAFAETTVTRGEWITKLVNTFNMTVEDDSTMPDNYFSDITSDMTCYRDILLAVEFGVIDLDAGEAFEPDKPATREFAAQTLNYCLRFQLDETLEYTYSESGEVSCPDDIQVAINRGWFTLSGNNFLPEQAVTADEADAMLDDAAAVLSGESIDEAHDNKYEFGENVKVIPQTATVTIDADYTVTISDYDCDISSGDIFVAYSAGIPVALKAVAVESGDNVTTITATQDGTENVVTSVDSEGVAEFDLENFETEEVETYSITDIETHETSEMQISLQSISYDKKAKKLTATKDVKISGSTSGSITVEVSDLKLYHKENTTSGDYMAYIQGNTSVTKSISFDLGNYLEVPSSITLGYINIGGVGNVSLDIDIALKGGMSANETGIITAGFSYARNDGFRLIKGYKKTAYSFTAEAEVKVGLTLSANIDLVVMSGRIWATVGVKGYFKFKDYTYVDGERPLQCKTIGGFLYANVGASASINYFIDKKSWSKTVDIYTESNSPIRVYYHYEDNQLVDCCTRGKDNNEVYIKYTTHTNSAYFNPSPSYGQGSYTGGDGTTTTLWTYTTDSEGNATITGYKGSASSLAIPSVIDGYTVTKIQQNAFKNNTKIRSIAIPDSVTEIGGEAFYECTSLSNVKLSKNIKVLEYNVFCGCTNLTSIEIPASLENAGGDRYIGTFAKTGLQNVTFEDGITKIPNNLFKNCTSLKSIIIPETVTEIGGEAFYGCTSLSNVKLSEYIEVLEYNVFCGCTNLTSIEIPASLKNAGSSRYIGTFAETGLQNVTFEDGITKIPNNLFRNCTSLKSITIPETVTEIGYGAFMGCSKLNTINFSEYVNYIGEDAFKKCTAITSITIPDSVTEIGGEAFYECTSLSNVKLSKNIKVLEYNVFCGCTNLTSIEIPASLENSGGDRYIGSFAKTGLQSVTFEDGITKIPNNLFRNCTSLKSITIPDSATEIGSYAFYGCTALNNVGMEYGIKDIDPYAFAYCTSLKEISIPDSVTLMGSQMFYECTSLEKVKLPNTRKTILASMFYNCKSLKNIVLPETVTEIGQNAFYGCVSLPSINLPDGLQTIEDNAFYECKALTDITIPKNVTSIGTSAFYNCDGLQKAVINASGTVGSQAFYDCDTLTSLTLSDSITKIGSSLCYGCDKLTDIKFGKYITEIPDSAFRKCAALQSVTLPRFCKTVAANAFAEDTKLTELYVPASVSSIQDNSFSYPRKMTVYGKDGSYAQEYASNKKMTFSAVNAPITEISFSDKAVTVDKYKTFTEPLNISPDFDTDTITFTSSDASVATVSETGEIYTRSYGSATITAKANEGNKTAEMRLTVEKPVHAESISLAPKSIRIRLGASAKLNVTLTPSNTTDTVRYSTSNSNVVTVEKGMLTAVGTGTAVITAITSNGLSDACTVTVLTDSVIVKLNAKKNGTFVTADVETVKVADGSKAMFAVYDNNGNLFGFGKTEVKNNKASAEIKARNAAAIKVFIWNAETLRPVTEAKEAVVQ